MTDWRDEWEQMRTANSRNGSARKPSSNGISSAGSRPQSESRNGMAPTMTPDLLGPATNIVRQWYAWIPREDQLAPSALIYKGVALAWKSQEAEPEHVFHWHDDPRKHPWCRKCQERVIPKMGFSGTITERPDPPTPADWTVKEVSA